MKGRVRALVTACALSFASAVAHAQAPPEPAATTKPVAVVVADVEEDATRDAQVRARLYEITREGGYDAAIGADPRSSAEQLGFLRAGVVTTDEAELQQLRTSLGTALLVRVSKVSDAGGNVTVKVTVVSDRGATSRSLTTAAGAYEDPVRRVLAELIGAPPPAAVSGAAAQPGASGETPPAERSVVAGSLVLPEGEGTPQSRATASELAEAWDKRGGARLTFGVHGLATVQQRRNVLVRDMGIVDELDENGIGGGIGVRLGLFYMPLPDPVLSQGVFPAFKLGIGLDSHFLYDRRPVGFVVTDNRREAQYEDEALWVVNAMPQVGLHLGIGRFKTESTWRGAVIGIAYSPALQFEKNFRDVEGEFRFNYAGMEVTVDITKLTTTTTEQGESQIRFMLFGLAPIDDDHPALASVGIGVTWY